MTKLEGHNTTMGDLQENMLKEIVCPVSALGETRGSQITWSPGGSTGNLGIPTSVCKNIYPQLPFYVMQQEPLPRPRENINKACIAHTSNPEGIGILAIIWGGLLASTINP